MKKLFVEAVPTVDKEQIQEDSRLQDLDIDSVSFISLVIELEETFEINFPDDDLDFTKVENFGTLCRDIYGLVKNKRPE